MLWAKDAYIFVILSFVTEKMLWFTQSFREIKVEGKIGLK